MSYTFGWKKTGTGFLLIVSSWTLFAEMGWADRISDIRRTKHNLSSTDYAGGPSRSVKATSESEVCVFCHTPHGALASTADSNLKPPLWNRKLSTQTYTKYSSSSIDATIQDISNSTGGTSKLCLSCHDGSIAIGNVNVLDGSYNSGGISIDMGTTTVMPDGTYGRDSGFTRNLGTDLTNDHPISFTYDSGLASDDGELRTPPFTFGATTIMGNRVMGSGTSKPILPLENNQVQCSTCHDPHIRDNGTSQTSIKFLRLNRFQVTAPATVDTFNPNEDIICLACHAKDTTGWYPSAHAQSTVASATYQSTPATIREFASGSEQRKVWEASCLNCHDTHTVKGAKRLLREGTDDTQTSNADPKMGGKPAVEETCYQCHRLKTDGINVLVNDANNKAPNIKSEFGLTYRMPITYTDQGSPGSEYHDILDRDFLESRDTLGLGGNTRRHVECTDCHNPHRVVKNKLFNMSGATTMATHEHGNGTHSNIASGVLRGIWGVEPNWDTFNTNWLGLPGSTPTDSPSGFTVKKGDGGQSASTDRSSSWVTREYQICMKCHSNYGYNDNGSYANGGNTSGRPQLLSGRGTTPSGTNSLTYYTNQASEWAIRANDSKTGTDQGTGANHRGWHPVTFPTGRSAALRGANPANWLAPFNSGSGDITMYCSDCHGSASANGSSSPTGGVWGPHGSTNPFILRGPWTSNTGVNQQGDICFKCHSYSVYATQSNTASGFGRGDGAADPYNNNYHGIHVDKVNSRILRCPRCHVAIPHGWKNKAFLVNLNCLGAEAGVSECTSAGSTPYSNAPYYMGAKLRIVNFAAEGSWVPSNCGTSSKNGTSWMTQDNNTCKDG